MIGQTISHYQVKRELGRGGMGVVYLAEDLRLGRQVALKALPTELSRDPLRRKRFEQEARACASLHHSAIASVFDLEEAGDELFIIFEYVDGEDLRALLQRGPLPIAQLLRLAQGIGQGLSAAHHAGIIHRDLKPENVRVNAAGQPKILDFGLARVQPELLSAAATFSFAVTQQGSIVGTVGYMSPEQLESKELDARSDIFSLGVILYEMAAGVHPFQGESPASTIANVLTKDPAPVEHLNPVQPPALDRIIRKCLAKKKEQRYQSVSDLLLDFEDVQRTSDDSMKTVVMRPDTAAVAAQESESLLASTFARAFPNMRRWWEMHHLFMAIAILMIFPILAWQVRGSLGGQLDLLFFFSVVTLTMIHFVFRGGMLLNVTLNPAKRLETIQRLGPVARLTHIVLCLSVVVAAPKFVTEHPLLGTFFAAMVIGGIVLSVFIEPWMERGAFPELARLREDLKAKDEASPTRGARQWWLIHHIVSMLGWTPMIALLPWFVRDWLPQANNVSNVIVFLCIVLAVQNFGFRAYVLEVAWFHREALEATVAKMATPILVCNLGLVALSATISALLFKSHPAPAAGFMVMAVGAVMIVGMLERNFNGYAFPALKQETAFQLDDLTRLGLMQLAYFASSAYLMAVAFLALEISWFAEIKAKVGIVTWLHRSVELFMGGTSMITVIVSPVMAWWLLVQRQHEVVPTLRKLFIFVAILYFGATGGALLFTLRYLSIPAGLVLLTGMLYGIWYQWVLANRISPASPLPSFRFDDLTRLGLTQLAYLAASGYLVTSLSAAVSTGRGWLSIKATVDIGAWADYFVGTSSMVTVAVSSVMAWALLVQRSRDAVAPFRQLFILVAVLCLGITGGVALLTLRYLSLPVALVLFTAMLSGIWYQWILANRIFPASSLSSFKFDDFTRLAAMQLLYIVPNIYLLATLLRQMDQVQKWLSQTPIPDDLYGVVSLTLACTISVLFQATLAWGLLQRRRDVVVSFKRWFVLFVLLALISMQGAMLFLARHTDLFVLLIGATALLYGVRYQWLLAKSILAADSEAVKSATAGSTPPPPPALPSSH